MNMGMSAQECKNVARAVACVLSDTYVLYVKTQGFHWNVTGPLFAQLHTMFETQYKELADAIDELAERIRALGEASPGAYEIFLKLSTLQEETGIPSSEAMIAQLLEDHESVVRHLRESFDVIDEAGDEATADLFTQRLRVHEKTAWMLRAMIE